MNKPFLPSPVPSKNLGPATGLSIAPPPGLPPWTTDQQEKLGLYRVVVTLMLGSMLWKSLAFPLLYSVYVSIPLNDSFFPALLRSPTFLAISYLLPILTGCSVLFFSPHPKWLVAQATITFGSVFVLCIHQGSYNDATFVTCFWTSAWCLWFVSRIDDPIDELLPKARKFGILIISMIFLGGAIGKWTPGYWSGEVLYQIYFVDRNYWIFNLLRARVDPDSLREVATYYSRMVIMTETCCACLWLLPVRLAAAVAITVFLGIVVFSNIYLFSVMLCLLGLAIIGLHEPKARQNQGIDASDD